MINRGLRLRDVGSEDFTVGDLYHIVTNLGMEASPLNLSINGEKFYYLSPEIQLLHSIEFQSRLDNYSKTKDGQKNRKPPYPRNLPGYPEYGPQIQEVDSTPHDEVHDLFFANYDESQFLTK